MREAEQQAGSTYRCVHWRHNRFCICMYLRIRIGFSTTYIYTQDVSKALSRSGKMAGILDAVRCDVLTAYDWIMYNESQPSFEKFDRSIAMRLITHVRINITSFSLSLRKFEDFLSENVPLHFTYLPFKLIFVLYLCASG